MGFLTKNRKCEFALPGRVEFGEKAWFLEVPDVSSIGDFCVFEKVIFVSPPRNSPKINKNVFFFKNTVFCVVLDHFQTNPFQNMRFNFEKKMYFFETSVFF